jgi:hypothetical protein
MYACFFVYSDIDMWCRLQLVGPLPAQGHDYLGNHSSAQLNIPNIDEMEHV